MTHHTDAERAEFDLMRFAFESKGSEAYKAWLIEVRDGDSYKPWDVVNDWRNWQTAWQAARRAPAAPVPQGWKLVPEWPTVEMSVAGDDVYREDGPEVFSSNTIYTRMLAAAPQTPEAGCSVSNGETQAAPVQLPEPQAEIEVRSMKTYLDLSIHEWRDTLPDGAYNIYTEHQVRELLAAHGIQERST